MSDVHATTHVTSNKHMHTYIHCIHESLPTQGSTCWKQAFVRSPNKANELCLTSCEESCMHSKRSVMILLPDTKGSTLAPIPSTKPLRRSRETIMKSFSGAIVKNSGFIWDALIMWTVCSMRRRHRVNIGSQYGKNPLWRAVATDDRHYGGGERKGIRGGVGPRPLVNGVYLE